MKECWHRGGNNVQRVGARIKGVDAKPSSFFLASYLPHVAFGHGVRPRHGAEEALALGYVFELQRQLVHRVLFGLRVLARRGGVSRH